MRTKKARKSRRRTKRPPFPLSAKRDLTQADVSPIANCLIEDNATSHFFSKRQVIYEAWISSLTTTTSRCFNVTTSVIAAFDMVHSLVQDKKRNHLILRFAYIHLMRAIDALNVARKKDPLYSQAYQKPGYNINSVANNIYLDVKKNTLDITPSRSQLSEYTRIGKRWLELAPLSPFQVSVYTRLAETIMYVLPAPCATPSILNILKSNNNSITEPSLKALGAEVQHISPELVRMLVSFSENKEAFVYAF